jgi:S-DNA-T family DNA segregation ATPase FtsK/SpoIIIE
VAARPKKTPVYETAETFAIGLVMYIMASLFAPAYAVYGIGSMLISGYALLMIFLKYDRFERMLEALGVGVDGKFPRIKEKVKTDYGWCYRLSVPPGVCTDDFEHNKQEIEQFFGHGIKINYANHNIFVEIYEIELEHLVPYVPLKMKGIEFPVGIRYGGKVATVDLSTGDPHMIIAGTSGGGKSTVLRSIITSLILSGVTLHLVDLKYGAEFAIFRNSKYVKTFAKTKGETYELLCSLIAEVERRYNLFYDSDCVDIKEYNKKHREKIGYELLIIDEFADLQHEKQSHELLEELSSKARACGIHLILSTQRPDAKVLDGRIKANCPVILGLKTMNDINSRIIIDDSGLQDLRGAGHGILKDGKPEEVQCYFLSTDMARKLVAPTNIDKRKKEEQPKEILDFGFMERLT